jgi:hypothetical protein
LFLPTKVHISCLPCPHPSIFQYSNVYVKHGQRRLKSLLDASKEPLDAFKELLEAFKEPFDAFKGL